MTGTSMLELALSELLESSQFTAQVWDTCSVHTRV